MDRFPTPKQSSKRAQGKYSRLRRELSVAIRSSVRETVCVVTVLDDHFRESLHAQEQVCSANELQSAESYDVIAAHANGADGTHAFEFPNTIKQALEHEDTEYWSEAILNEVANLEDVFMAFGPPVKRTPDMSESRMRSLVHTSPSQVHLTMRGMWRDFCT